ncbi:Transmembrane domain-containing protein [Spironucleus salmonicida]|uniref:Transmembrane domain-containing protein n=1 Tax=Spironucleus salmonicida TaxID=348837 RepID=A0A9P8LLC4_9EUKA|nr:Transmembrane domain-containing protein [Spironucleus salmonicida]
MVIFRNLYKNKIYDSFNVNQIYYLLSEFNIWIKIQAMMIALNGFLVYIISLFNYLDITVHSCKEIYYNFIIHYTIYTKGKFIAGVRYSILKDSYIMKFSFFDQKIELKQSRMPQNRYFLSLMQICQTIVCQLQIIELSSMYRKLLVTLKLIFLEEFSRNFVNIMQFYLKLAYVWMFQYSYDKYVKHCCLYTPQILYTINAQAIGDQIIILIQQFYIILNKYFWINCITILVTIIDLNFTVIRIFQLQQTRKSHYQLTTVIRCQICCYLIM